jgi:hypothetical protein
MLMADHDSFIGPYTAYAVEEQVVHGALPDASVGDVAPGAKVFVRYGDADEVPAPPTDASCVVDQRVLQTIMPGSPELALVRTVWMDDRGDANDLWGDAIVTREVRMKPPF